MAYKQQKSISHSLVLEAGKSKTKGLADSVSVESLLPGSEMSIFSMCPHTVDMDERALWGLFYEGTNPIRGGSALMT